MGRGVVHIDLPRVAGACEMQRAAGHVQRVVKRGSRLDGDAGACGKPRVADEVVRAAGDDRLAHGNARDGHAAAGAGDGCDLRSGAYPLILYVVGVGGLAHGGQHGGGAYVNCRRGGVEGEPGEGNGLRGLGVQGDAHVLQGAARAGGGIIDAVHGLYADRAAAVDGAVVPREHDGCKQGIGVFNIVILGGIVPGLRDEAVNALKHGRRGVRRERHAEILDEFGGVLPRDLLEGARERYALPELGQELTERGVAVLSVNVLREERYLRVEAEQVVHFEVIIPIIHREAVMKLP